LLRLGVTQEQATTCANAGGAVVMLKAADNPPMLLPGARAVGELRGQWWVAHTRPRFEKAFAWDLAERHVGYFLPMVERIIFSGGRKRRIKLPLFPSYVFVCGSEDDRRNSLGTDRLCRTIAVADQSRLRNELMQLERALSANAPLDLYPFAAVGRRCRVRAGAMIGVEGIVIERWGVTRLVLEVRTLGQVVAVEIETDLLEPAD
jgi:transcriptional antiterminator RfaH